MTNKETTGFGQFIPGFEFLKGLTQGGSGLPNMGNMPNMSSWIAPSMSVEELDKRIEELKHVQFWLEQNSRALAATVQALEVQKMTMATLRGMNFNLADIASALTPRPATAAAAAAKTSPPQAQPEPAAAKPTSRKRASKKANAGGTPAGMVDPLKLWGALTQQFQQIAATAVKDVAAAHAKNATPSGAARAGAQAAASAASSGPRPNANSTANPTAKPAAAKTTRRAAPRKRAAS